MKCFVEGTDRGCELAVDCDPRLNCRKSLTDTVSAGNWWGHDWTPIKSLKNDRFLGCIKYLNSDWDGVKVGRRFTSGPNSALREK